MSSNQTMVSKAKALRLMQLIGPLSSFIVAAIIYVFLDIEFKTYIAALIVVIGVMELFIFRSLADKAERQAERDRG